MPLPAISRTIYIGIPAILPMETHSGIFPGGRRYVPGSCEGLEQAQHYIFIEYFIIHDGVMWRTILDILEKKVKEGLDVRLIYDDMAVLPHFLINIMKPCGRRASSVRCSILSVRS